MVLPKLLSLLVFFAVCATIPALAASDIDKEKRWADQIVDSLLVGQAEWLEADGQKFLGIYTEDQSGEPKGGVILLHGIGVHPDWPDIIQPLRSELPNHGWATLSIQLPILPNEATLKDYIPLIKDAAPRIQAAQTFLQSKGNEPVVLIAHSLGATMGAAYLAESPDSGLIGFATIGMSDSDLDPVVNTTAQIAKIKLPMLDLYGSRDLDTVLAAVQPRAAAARKAVNPHYRQLEIVGADHFFVGLDEELVSRMHGWLEQLIKPRTPAEPEPPANTQPAPSTAPKPEPKPAPAAAQQPPPGPTTEEPKPKP